MIGTVISGRYEITTDAEGDGVFDAYRGTDRASGKPVFLRKLKETALDNPDYAEALRDTVGVVKNIKNPGVERVLGFEWQGEDAYLISEFFEGQSLDSRLRRLASFSVPVAVKIAIDTAEALEAVHRGGVVHGDISPKTVFTTSQDSVKVVTAGFWKAYAHSEKAARVKSRQMVPYLAPEVAEGGMPSTMSDVYSLGVLLWQMIAGRLPQADEGAGANEEGLHPGVPSLRKLVPAVPEALDKAIQKATAREPLERYASMQRFFDDLKTIQDGLRFGRPLTWPLKPVTEPSADEQKVAPELNAVDANPRTEDSRRKRSRPEPDVSDKLPAWLSGLVYLVIALVLVMVGAWVFFNLQKPKALMVPDLVGREVDAARRELEDLRLGLRVVEQQANDNHPKGTIVSMAPSPGSEVKEGARVSVIVSSGSRFVELPDLRGRSLSEAQEIAAELDLVIDSADITYQRDRDLPKGTILEQWPDALLKVERYTSLRLVLSNGDERVTTSGRDAPRSQREFKMTVPSGVEGAVEVMVEIVDARGRRTVYESNHFAGDEIGVVLDVYGETALFRVFFDGVLAETYNADFRGDEE